MSYKPPVPSSFSRSRETFHDVLHEDDRAWYALPAGGIIERIELVPLIDAWNTDAGAPPYRLAVRMIAPDGSEVPLHVELISRGIDPGTKP